MRFQNIGYKIIEISAAICSSRKTVCDVLEWIHIELAKKGVNLSLLWTEYQQKFRQCSEIPYMYTQFCEIYRDWARKNKATMRIHHKPGDAMEVDWAGDTLQITDLATGETTDAYLFVAVLQCSCFAYTEFCRDMKLENWLMCHVHACEYFNGVSRLLIIIYKLLGNIFSMERVFAVIHYIN
jgi:transposase